MFLNTAIKIHYCETRFCKRKVCIFLKDHHFIIKDHIPYTIFYILSLIRPMCTIKFELTIIYYNMNEFP